MQEDSTKNGKVTSAGMYFLGFPVYRLDQTMNSVSCYHKWMFFTSNLSVISNFKYGSIIFLQIAASKDPDTSFFKKLDGFQPCELTELKAGTHIFAVYGNTLLCSVMLVMFLDHNLSL